MEIFIHNDWKYWLFLKCDEPLIMLAIDNAYEEFHYVAPNH